MPRASQDRLGPGRTVLITGASSGIGAATATQFAAAGYRVFGTSRHRRPERDDIHMLRMDVRDDASVTDAITELTSRAEDIDVLVNNAGIMQEGFAEETSRTQADAIFETNFFGTIRVINAVLPRMRACRYGRIINVGSLAGRIGEPGEGIYAASKAALARYTEALRHEVWHLGIRVSLVEPGAFASTNVLNTSDEEHGDRIADYDGPREAVRRTLHRAFDRGGDPRDVAVLIEAISRAGRPRARYAVGREARLVPLLTSLLPQRLTDYLLRRAYRLPNRSTRG